ncbi:MAG: Zn-dependent oligopeptidase, partial [Chlamydiae bacterium]|nr:Zn-dependent oligopeptidase [Chlamydiota bacterium]
MKKILSRGLMLAVVGMSALGAYEYTSIQRVEDIYPLYPKTLEEVQQRAEVTEKKFHQSVEAFLKSRLSASALLRRWDELEAAMGASMNIFSTIALVEPDDKLRQACDAAYQKLQQKWITTLSERVELYRKLDKAYQKEGKRLQEDEKYYLQQILQEMRLEGMHLPEKQREQVKALKIELSKLSESFSKNIQEDKSCIKVAKEGLEGVAGDFQAQLKEDAEGYKIVTCDYPVYFKVMKSCLSSDTRRALYRAFMNRAYPQNDTVLQAIIAKRDELAHLLGFDSFAALQLSQEMVQRPQRAEAFLRELSE